MISELDFLKILDTNQMLNKVAKKVEQRIEFLDNPHEHNCTYEREYDSIGLFLADVCTVCGEHFK